MGMITNPRILDKVLEPSSLLAYVESFSYTRAGIPRKAIRVSIVAGRPDQEWLCAIRRESEK